jgi:hypothetical protein
MQRRRFDWNKKLVFVRRLGIRGWFCAGAVVEK